MKLIDLTGERFGRLLVLGRSPAMSMKPRWRVRCECGAEKDVSGSNLRTGHTQSCGCLHREALIEVGKRTGAANGRAGALKRRRINAAGARRRRPRQYARVYRCWIAMIGRCRSTRPTPSRAKTYANYAGRGITVCAAWRNSFEAFHAYMGDPPTERHTLDRFPDNDGNYEPGNVRWATVSQQNRNMRNTLVVTVDGVRVSLRDLAEQRGIRFSRARYRFVRGWPLDRILNPNAYPDRNGRTAGC